MLYMKAKRSEVMSECTLKESAVINQILGRRWHLLSREEQAEYYKLAQIEKQIYQIHYSGCKTSTSYLPQIKSDHNQFCLDKLN